MLAAFRAHPQTRLAAFVVWIDMLAADSLAAAEDAAAIFADDPRVEQFFDADEECGAAVAASVGAAHNTAWDFYATYDASATWDAAPPAPLWWAHQLMGAPWVAAERYRTGAALAAALHDAVASLTA